MGEGDSGRRAFRTADSDYHTVDFTAYITFDAIFDDNNWSASQIWFGIGEGDRGPSNGNIDRSVIGANSVYQILNFNAAGTPAQMYYAQANTALVSGGFTLMPGSGKVYGPGADFVNMSTSALRMLYSADTGNIQFDIDYDYAGDITYSAFTADQTFDVGQIIPTGVKNNWDSFAASRIFFGGDSSTLSGGGNTNDDLVFRDFVVVLNQDAEFAVLPEPSTFGLIAIAAAGLMASRRQRRLRTI
jgi:hypothetical protein